MQLILHSIETFSKLSLVFPSFLTVAEKKSEKKLILTDKYTYREKTALSSKCKTFFGHSNMCYFIA